MPLVLWLVLSFGLTALAPPPPKRAITASRAAVPVIPTGYTVRQARDFGVACDGAKDDTIGLQNALNALNDHHALQLPAGTCLTSHQLLLSGKSNVAVVGAGKDRTILQATDPLHSTFFVRLSSNVRLSGFQVYSPNSAGMKRTSDPLSKGFLVKNSGGVVLDGIKARQVAGAGVMLNEVRDSKILNSEVIKSLADAFHVTGGSENIIVQGNLAENGGDDGFASIGYGDALNRNIQFLDNVVRDESGGSGVSFEGTNGGKAYRNRIYRSGAGGIRIASQSNWKTGPSDNLDIQDNYLEGCVTRRRIGHGSVMIFTNFKNIGPNITILRTTIKNPTSGPGFRAFGGPRVGATVAARVDDSTMSGVNKDYAIGANAMISNDGNRLLSRSERQSTRF
jgi:trimeric autotransporter adhesin